MQVKPNREKSGAAKDIGNLPFIKLQGLGNDFVLVSEDDLNSSCPELNYSPAKLNSKWVQTICNRNFGIGADGLIVFRSSVSDLVNVPKLFVWDFYNSDGSVAEVCGNGLRCFALFLYEEKHISAGEEFDVLTGKGLVRIRFDNQDEIFLDLGEPIFNADKIPVIVSGNEDVLPIVALNLFDQGRFADKTFATVLSMGNPHCVIINPEIESCDYIDCAKQIQELDRFPKSTNVEFAKIISPVLIDLFVYERGAGVTLACASGACATLVAAVLSGHAQRKATVRLPGGELKLYWREDDSHVCLTGPARISFRGFCKVECKT